MTADWREIPGWCDFEWLYQEQVQRAAPGSVFVEIGTWVGRSTCLMAQLIRDSGKNICFYAIDHANGSPELTSQIDELRRRGTTLREELLANVRRCGVEDFVTPYFTDSVAAAGWFGPKSVDFVFVDGNHEEESVEADIVVWLPAVRGGGLLAGHDWHLKSVKNAVLRHFLPVHRGSCWLHEVPDA
jgi:predicted O-methyltransferase YrrM